MDTPNGHYRDLDQIKADVREIKDDLARSIEDLTHAVNALTRQFGAFIRVAENSIPIKAVFWMFLILVLTMVGVKGVEVFTKIYLGI